MPRVKSCTSNSQFPLGLFQQTNSFFFFSYRSFQSGRFVTFFIFCFVPCLQFNHAVPTSNFHRGCYNRQILFWCVWSFQQSGHFNPVVLWFFLFCFLLCLGFNHTVVALKPAEPAVFLYESFYPWGDLTWPVKRQWKQQRQQKRRDHFWNTLLPALLLFFILMPPPFLKAKPLL